MSADLETHLRLLKSVMCRRRTTKRSDGIALDTLYQKRRNTRRHGAAHYEDNLQYD